MYQLSATFIKIPAVKIRRSATPLPFAWAASNQQRTLTQRAFGFASNEALAKRAATAAFAGHGGETVTEIQAADVVELG